MKAISIFLRKQTSTLKPMYPQQHIVIYLHSSNPCIFITGASYLQTMFKLAYFFATIELLWFCRHPRDTISYFNHLFFHLKHSNAWNCKYEYVHINSTWTRECWCMQQLSNHVCQISQNLRSMLSSLWIHSDLF